MALILPKKRLLTRRGFLTGAAAAIAAPAIIRAQSLGGNSGISAGRKLSGGGGGRNAIVSEMGVALVSETGVAIIAE